MSENQPIDEPKVKPNERWERTDTAFRHIVHRETAAREAKTARLRRARLEMEAEQGSRGHDLSNDKRDG